MDDVSMIVAAYGAMADETLDAFVRAQERNPITFKELTEVFLDSRGEPGAEFFLATVLATAVIQLAANA